MRILIADDHAIVREGLRALIETEPDMELACEAADGLEAVALAEECRPDVILIDLVMPRMDGITAIRQIQAALPGARILVLTSFAEDERVYPAIKSGALGYLLKDSSPQQLLQAIREVYRGEPALHPSIARKLMSELRHPATADLDSGASTVEDDRALDGGRAAVLTERELEVLGYVARGMSNDEIAAELVLSERTVRTHVSNILAKLHLVNRTQAALYAMRSGLAEPGRT